MRSGIGAIIGVAIIGWIGTVGAYAQTASKPAKVQPPPAAKAPATKEAERAEREEAKEAGGYRGLSNFFNVREAYSNTEKGEWEFEAGSKWFTRRDHERDEVEVYQSLKYGVTDDFHLELEVSEPLGYGGEGVGELTFTVFNTFWHESDWLPAFGGRAAMRIPSGYESSGVDGTFTGIFTKTLLPRFRAHFLGYVRTANGAPGNEEEENRRAFQWGLGPGFDYQITDATVAVLNYLHKVSDEYGEHNNNILELGVVHHFPENGRFHHMLKLAAEVGLDGQPDTPKLGAKLQWEVDWK